MAEQQNTNGANSQQNTNATNTQQTQMVPVDTSQYTADVDNSTVEKKSKGPVRWIIGTAGKTALALMLAVGAVQFNVIEGINKTAKNTGKDLRKSALLNLEDQLYKMNGMEMPGVDKRKLDESRSLSL